MKNFFLNNGKSLWKEKIFHKQIFKNNNKSFKQKNLTMKIFFHVSKNTSIFKFQLFPFQIFSANFRNSYKKQTQKNQKFLKPKKDIIFSGNFQKFFVFFQKQKKVKKENQETFYDLIYKKKIR
eukprot:GHUV01030367.1.p1 GENE.GHUV01030367.1~~GHUV01030367.1.p1  ORF type:complete len:142 (+),score=8.63 GHUV01030367.1:58-426(+)